MKEKSKEKNLQKQVNELLDWMKIKYIHLTTFIKRRVLCPHCKKWFHVNFPVEGNKGALDHYIFVNGKCLIFEYKVNNNKLTKEQIEWRNYLRKMGIEIKIINTFEAAKSIIDKENDIQKQKEHRKIREDKYKRMKYI